MPEYDNNDERCEEPETVIETSAEIVTETGTYLVPTRETRFTMETDGTQVCPAEEPDEPSPGVSAKKHGISGGKLAVILAAVLLLIICVGAVLFFVTWYYSSEQRVLRAIENGEYDKAVSLMTASGAQLENQDSIVRAQLLLVKQNYESGSIDAETALRNITDLRILCTEELKAEADETERIIRLLQASADAYAEAETALEAQDYPKAMQCLGMIPVEDTARYDDAQQKLAECTDAYRQKLLADARAVSDTPEHAISLLETGLELLPEDEILLAEIGFYQERLTEQEISAVLKKAAAESAKKHYAAALDLLRSAAEEYDDTRITDAIENYTTAYVNGVLVTAEEYIGAQEYDAAITVLETACALLPDHAQLSGKLLQVQEEKTAFETAAEKNRILAEAADAASAGDYREAVRILRDAAQFSDDALILEALAEYESYLAVPLKELRVMKESNCEFVSSAEDPRGNTHEDVLRMKSSTSTTARAEFYLDGAYTRFTCRIYADKGFTTDNVSECIYFYLDDEETPAYTAESITYKTDGIEVELDVAGAEYLLIQAGDSDYLDFFPDHTYCILEDAKLYG